jgi:hypothetical protein
MRSEHTICNTTDNPDATVDNPPAYAHHLAACPGQWPSLLFTEQIAIIHASFFLLHCDAETCLHICRVLWDVSGLTRDWYKLAGVHRSTDGLELLSYSTARRRSSRPRE